MEPVHESEVLKALDLSIRNDEDSWPQFPLRDVTIVSQKTDLPTSLLQAHKTGKVRVIGTLHDQDADQESRKRFKKRFQKQQRIYIANVDMYSYGKYEDDSLAFWAAGEAGWFELRTQAEDYKRVYVQMEEATEMLYYLIARAGRQRKDWTKATNAQVETIMIATFKAFKESELNKHRTGDWKDCREGFLDHRHFLMKCMLEGAEGIDWDKTPFLRWFEKLVPQDYALIRQIVQQTGSASIEELPSEPAPTVTTTSIRQRAPQETTMREMTPEKPQPTGRRSRRLAEAAASDEGNSSDELSRKRGRARGKHKRKSMLRIPGSAKTPRKTNVGPRRDGLYAVREPDMEYFRGQRKLDEDEEGKEFLPERLPEDSISPGLVRDLEYTDLDEDTETAAPTDNYWVAKGPSGTWSCPIDGCAHQVWDADSSTGHEMVKTHYAQVHQDSIEELIQSESRPWARTSYLLEKVRSMKAQGLPAVDESAQGKAAVRKREEPEQVFPAPIKRVLRY